jgi:hypothetical protein
MVFPSRRLAGAAVDQHKRRLFLRVKWRLGWRAVSFPSGRGRIIAQGAEFLMKKARAEARALSIVGRLSPEGRRSGPRAFSSDVETGSREENAQKQKTRAPGLMPSGRETL